MIIKNKEFKRGKVNICIPVVADNKDKVIEAVKKIVSEKPDVIEFRVDYLKNLNLFVTNGFSEITDILKEVKSICEDILLLFTYRSSLQGGNGNLIETELFELLVTVAESGYADLIDVEYFPAESHSERRELISKLKNYGVKVIGSYHDFNKTPSLDEMLSILNGIKNQGCDIVKMAVMPKTESDVLRLLTITDEFSLMNEDVPLITMSMGDMGKISRISGKIFGSCMTFSLIGEASAPGQIELDGMREIFKYI